MQDDISPCYPAGSLRRAGPPSPVAGFAGRGGARRTAGPPCCPPPPSCSACTRGRCTARVTIWDPAQRPPGLVRRAQPAAARLAPERGRVEVVIDGTYFMNGNALDAAGRLIHCEHGRRCISRSTGDGDDRSGGAHPFITHYQGKRINSPNDLVRRRGRRASGSPTRCFGLLDAEPGQPGGAGAGPSQRLPLRRAGRLVAPHGGFRAAERPVRSRRTAGRSTCRTRPSRCDEIPGPQTGTHARDPGVRRGGGRHAVPTAGCSAARTTAYPDGLQGRPRAAGSGPRPATASTSSPPDGVRLGFFPNAELVAVQLRLRRPGHDAGCSSPPRSTCWRSICLA